jgi:HK97 family phage prohead protease
MSELEKKYLEVPFSLEKKGIVDIDGEKFFEFEGYASVFNNIDRGMDRVIPGAFKNFIASIKAGEKDYPVALWQHNSDNPIGIYVELKEDDRGLFVKGRLPMEDDFVSKKVVPQLKIKSVRKMSIGYKTLKSTFVEEDDELIRNLEELDLWEISLVTFAMNNEADITSIKSLENIENIKSLSEVETLLKELGLSNKKSKALISRIKELKSVRDGQDESSLVDEKKTAEIAESFKQIENSLSKLQQETQK